MIVAKIIGTVVATRKHEKLVGHKIQVIQPLDPKTLEPADRPLVAVDAVGAGVGEQVIAVTGSSARRGVDGIGVPVDATIIGIIDQLEIDTRHC